MKKSIVFFLILIIIPNINLVLASSDYGEDDPYLGQFVDDYLNNDYVNITNNIIHNETLNCMELEYQSTIWKTENLITYQETDPNNVIDHLGDYYILHEYGRNHEARMWYDFGEGYFNDAGLVATFEVKNNFTTDSWNNHRFFYLCNQSDINFEDIVDYVGLHIRKDGSGIQFLLMVREGAIGSLSDVSLPISINKWYYLDVLFDGNNFTVNIWNNELKTLLFDTLYVNDITEFNGDWNFRYLYVAMGLNTGHVKSMKTTSGNYRFLSGGYVDGYYIESFNLTGMGLALLTNSSIFNDTAITMAFSNDYINWVNHNAVLGYDILSSGFESVDMRDLNFTDGFVRFNMSTSDTSITPLMYQFRIINLTTEVITGGIDNTPSIILAIFLIIVGISLIYSVRRK